MPHILDDYMSFYSKHITYGYGVRKLYELIPGEGLLEMLSIPRLRTIF